MKPEYYLADPTGNITVLVRSPVEEGKLAETASELMALERTAEQLGFLRPGNENYDIELRMAGGEFCANATMSTAAVFCLENGMDSGKVSVKASGENLPVTVEVCREESGNYRGTVHMPLPEKITEEELAVGGSRMKYPVVAFRGIIHVISTNKLKKQEAEEAAVRWCNELHADALGIMQLDEERQTITPLVYVRKAETLFWESSCASGTAAAGAWLYRKAGKDHLTVEFREPAGMLKIEAEKDSLRLTGSVKILKKPAITEC